MSSKPTSLLLYLRASYLRASYLRVSRHLLPLLALIIFSFSQPIHAQVTVSQSANTQTTNAPSSDSSAADTLPQPNRLADDFVSVSLLVAEPGEVLYSILGHAALRLQCPYYDLDYVFSYESEDVRGKVWRFLTNNLKMGMVEMPTDYYLQPYLEEGRGVSEYYLNLPADVKSELWRTMDEKVAEGMYLEYDYIKRGCAIAVVHCVDNAIKSANKLYGSNHTISYSEWGKPFERTLREIVYDNSPVGWQRFYGMTIVGGQVDNPNLPKKEKLIIPRELVQTWQKASIDEQPLLTNSKEVLPIVNTYNGERFTPLYASLILLFLAILSFIILSSNNKEKQGKMLTTAATFYEYFMLVVQTLLGCLMLWLLLSPLPGSEWSWLLIPFNPLPAILWKWRDKWSIYYLALVAVWSIAMLAAPHRLVEYAHIILAIACAIVVCSPKKTYNNK